MPHLVHFFNICLENSIFPAQLKTAVIKPIFKTGDPTSFSNYRPISILPFLSKILEKLIYIRLIHHFNVNALLSDKQFGFRKGHSTYMPIMLIQDLITKALEEDELVVGIFHDLKKPLILWITVYFWINSENMESVAKHSASSNRTSLDVQNLLVLETLMQV